MKKKFRLISIALVAVLMVITSGCSHTVSSKLELFKESMTEQETTSTKVNKINKIWINNKVGTITINKTQGEDVKVIMKKTVRGQDKNEIKEVIDTIKPKTEVINERLEIEAVTRDGKSDIWSWISSNHDKLSVNVDLVIDIPESFKDYTVKNVTGNVIINDVTGCLNVENITGNINLNNNILYGNNHISLATGDIDMNVDLKNADAIEAIDCTGNVLLTIPSTSELNLSTRVVTGAINGNFKGLESKSGVGGIEFKGEFNGGGKNVILKTTTGNIQVNSR